MTGRSSLLAVSREIERGLPVPEPEVVEPEPSLLLAEDGAPQWSWWLRDLQHAVGSIVAGRVYVIGARPSCGKTALVQNLFWHLGRQMEGTPIVLSAWTERARPAALMSIASLIEGYDEDRALRRAWDELPDGAREKLQARLRDFENARESYPIINRACPTSDEIAEALERYQPTVFLLDYLQKVRPTNRQTTFDAWLATMTHCTEYAASGGTVVIGSQLKRKGDGVFDKYRPPFMEDFKGGGAIEEGANLALGLYRPLRRMTGQEEREVKAGREDLEKWKQHGVMAIKVLKHTFWGSAADRIVRVRVEKNRRVVNYEDAPVSAGDAWEQEDVPF